MHRIILDIEDSAIQNVNYLINSLPEQDVHIISDSVITSTVDINKLKSIVSENDLFKTIKDPVAWQKDIRNEW